MGVRYGVSGLGAQVLDSKGDRISKYSSDNGNYEIATSILVCAYIFMICLFSAIHYVNKAVTRRILNRDRELRK